METPAGQAPASNGGQAGTPASTTGAPSPASTQTSGAEAGQGGATDPFDFGGSAPSGTTGQGTTATPTVPPTAAATDKPPVPPVVPPVPGQGKDWLKDEFGGDVIKLNTAYGALVPKFTKVSQRLASVTSILKQLDEAVGPEIRKALISKGLVQPTAEELSSMNQPSAGQPGQPAQPPQPGVHPTAGQPPMGQPPAEKPLTRTEALQLWQEQGQMQERFQFRMQEFKTATPDIEQFKEELGMVLPMFPGLADQIAEGSDEEAQLAWDNLMTLARGKALPRLLDQTHRTALEEGLRGKQARQDAHLETPSMGTTGGGDPDPWDFGKTP